MRFGLQINQFTWPGGAAAIGPTLGGASRWRGAAAAVGRPGGRGGRAADDAGFDSIWVMDHFFQIRGLGPPEAPMLEGLTALGFLAAHSDRAGAGLMGGG